MELKHVLEELTKGYIHWYKEGNDNYPKQGDAVKFGKVMCDCLNKAYTDANAVALTLKGNDTDREAVIGFAIVNEKCIISAWNKRYEVPLEELEQTKKQNLEYGSEESSGKWAYCFDIAEEAKDFVASLLENVIKEDGKDPFDDVSKGNHKQTTLDENL